MSDLPKVKYLEDSFRTTGVKYDYDYDTRQGITEEGYTTNAGAPTRYMLQIDGKQMWHRVYVWQISNNGTAFVRLRGRRYVIRNEGFLRAKAKESQDDW
jgi:hypothetical protein